MLINVSLSEATTIERPYGKLYALVVDEEVFVHLRVNVITVEPGERTSKHSHPQEEVFYFLSGEGIVLGDSAEYRASPGEAVLVPPGSVHQIINASHENDLVYLVAMSPPRTTATVTYYD